MSPSQVEGGEYGKEAKDKARSKKNGEEDKGEAPQGAQPSPSAQPTFMERPNWMDTTGSEAPQQEMTGKQLIEFSCIRNAAYHEDMEAFYARWHRIFMFVVVALGTASIGASLRLDSPYANIGTAIAVLAGLIDLLWDVDGNARRHSNLRRRCFDLLARLEANENLDGIKAEFVRIVADEPPAMHAVNALAFNAAVDAMGRPPGQKYKLDWSQTFFRHWIRYQPNQFSAVEKT
jgi:hypothetical protein